MKKLAVAAAVLFAAVACMNMSFADDDEKPEFTIKQVMKKCMKGGLCKKVASGKANDDEKEQLLKMFTALSKNKPPKGDAESWKEKSGALVKGAKLAVDGDAGAGAALKKAANCAACHKKHK